jgi:hypothetical protein
MIHSELFGQSELTAAASRWSGQTAESFVQRKMDGGFSGTLRKLLPAFKLPLPFLHFFISVLLCCDRYVDHVIEVRMLR